MAPLQFDRSLHAGVTMAEYFRDSGTPRSSAPTTDLTGCRRPTGSSRFSCADRRGKRPHQGDVFYNSTSSARERAAKIAV